MTGALFDGLKEARQCLEIGSNDRQVQFPADNQSNTTQDTIAKNYRIAGIFRGVIFSWFSWSRGEPRLLFTHEKPRVKTRAMRVPRVVPRARAQNGCGSRDHEKAKITTFTKILPLKKYPLYGITS